MPLVEKRYAEALLLHSGKNTYRFKEELESFVNIYKQDKDLKSFLLDPTIKANKKQQLLTNVFETSLEPGLLKFLLLLIEKHRMMYVESIYTQYVKLAQEIASIIDMKIISADPLTEQQIEAIKNKFILKYKATSANADIILDKELIGGVKVIIGDKVYDGSIKGQIDSLKQLLIK